MHEIAGWLKKLGLEQYAQLFAENGIDFGVLPDLTEQDLEKLGVLLGHRRKMLRAIAELEARTSFDKAALESARADDIERRHLTVMFCDLVGSTALSAPRPRGSTHGCQSLSSMLRRADRQIWRICREIH